MFIHILPSLVGLRYVEKEAEPVKDTVEKLIRNVNQSAKELETDRDLTSYQISIILNTMSTSLTQIISIKSKEQFVTQLKAWLQK